MSSISKPFQLTSHGVFMERRGAGWNDERRCSQKKLCFYRDRPGLIGACPQRTRRSDGLLLCETSRTTSLLVRFGDCADDHLQGLPNISEPSPLEHSFRGHVRSGVKLGPDRVRNSWKFLKKVLDSLRPRLRIGGVVLAQTAAEIDDDARTAHLMSAGGETMIARIISRRGANPAVGFDDGIRER